MMVPSRESVLVVGIELRDAWKRDMVVDNMPRK